MTIMHSYMTFVIWKTTTQEKQEIGLQSFFFPTFVDVYIHVLTWTQLHYHSPHNFHSICTRCCQKTTCSVPCPSAVLSFFSIYDIYKQKPFWVKTQLEVLLFLLTVFMTYIQCFHETQGPILRYKSICSSFFLCLSSACLLFILILCLFSSYADIHRKLYNPVPMTTTLEKEEQQ